MLVYEGLDRSKYLTMKELEAVLGWGSHILQRHLRLWFRSEKPLRVAFDGVPNLTNGTLDDPELLFRIDDVVSFLEDTRLGITGRQVRELLIGGGGRLLMGLQDAREPLCEEFVSWASSHPSPGENVRPAAPEWPDTSEFLEFVKRNPRKRWAR